MIMYSRELTVAWGESDPFGLVYYPMMFTWFNETEHELLRGLGFGTKELITSNRTAFVMGDVHFRFIGPAAYGDRVRPTMKLVDVRTFAVLSNKSRRFRFNQRIFGPTDWDVKALPQRSRITSWPIRSVRSGRER